MNTVTETRSCAKDHTPAQHHHLFEYVETQGEFADIPTIHVLNDDCLDYILSFFNPGELFHLSLVCRRWYNLCLSMISRLVHLRFGELEGILGYNRVGLFHENEEEAHQFNKTISLIKSILSLNTGGLTALSIDKMDYTNFIHYLDFIETFGDFSLQEMSSIGIYYINLSDHNTDDCAIDEIALFIKNNIGSSLNSLALSISSNSNQSALKEIFSEAVNLEHLCVFAEHTKILNLFPYYTLMDLPKSAPIKSFSIQNFPAAAQCLVLEYVIRNFHSTLEYLNLYPRRNSFEVDDALKISSPATLSKLHKMKIFSVSYNNPFKTVSNQERILPEIVQHRAKPIDQLLTILKLMPNLKVLYLCSSGTDDFKQANFIEMLAQYCPLLEELHLIDCWIPTDHFAALQNLKFLKRLDIDYNRSYHSPINDTHALSKEYLALSFKVIAPIMPNLKQLEYMKILVRYSDADQPDADDLIQVLHNAGPNFKGLATCVRDSYVTFGSSGGLLNLKVTGRVNLIEEVLKKCSRLDLEMNETQKIVRAKPILIVIEGPDSLHLTGCPLVGGFHVESCHCSQNPGYYNDIAPDWVRVDYRSRDRKNDNDIFREHFSLCENLEFLNRRVACKYVQLPKIRI